MIAVDCRRTQCDFFILLFKSCSIQSKKKFVFEFGVTLGFHASYGRVFGFGNMSRASHAVAILGNEFCASMSEMRVLIVGAGGIGCELGWVGHF